MAAKANYAALLSFVGAACLTVYSSYAAAQSSGLASLRLDGQQPIAIDADRLEVLEGESKAVFSGAVNVAQGGTSLQAGKLTVFYAKGGSGSAATGSAAIERLEMTGKVIIKSERQTATGDAGSFNVKSNTFVLTGSRVVLSEGGSVATGCKLTVNMNSGKANLESCKNGDGRVKILINRQGAQGN